MNKKLTDMFNKLESEYEVNLVKWIRKTRPKLYTVLRNVSSSGMSRVIDVYIIRDNKPVWISHLVSQVTHYKRDKKYNGLKVGGCGMDMGFAVAYDFSSTVFPTGFRYRKNEHHRNNDPAPVDPDGGYALKQEWI